MAVQQILHQVCGLLFRHVLRMAVGALQKCRIRMTQQGCRHLFTGAFLQQIGCVEMPQGMSKSGKSLNYTHTKNPLAGPRWDEAVMAAEGDAMAADLARYMRRMLK